MQNTFPGFRLQEDPPIYVVALPGRWLISRATPSWRIQDPIQGFQRMVDQRRARQIAATVLSQERTFPNAIVLATDSKRVSIEGDGLRFPSNIRFLVIDGQHRLWAQEYSEFDATYACLVHPGLDERKMAELFLEINDTQKRVPSSLRWDLVRLVQPEDDPAAIRATDLLYDLSTQEDSPLFQRIDLTGEQPEITLKQGSLAPEFKKLTGGRISPLRELGYEAQMNVLKSFFVSVKECDPDGWETAKGALYKARVLRALLNLLPEMLRRASKEPQDLGPQYFYTFMSRIDLQTLSSEEIRAQQGSAGIAAITNTIRDQIF
jgi:DGQHR domain-containing protein